MRWTLSSVTLGLLVVALLVSQAWAWGEKDVREPRHPIDPDANRDMCAIIQAKGYPCEEHYATTDDGYILGMFRLPQKGPPVLLQHGLLDSSFTWVMNYPTQSFSYILYDLGYDVWLGNNRGNTYSTNHTHLSPDKEEFWKFSWDEMALYDFPTQMQYALSNNQANYSKIIYVGHSEGTTQAFAGLAAQPQLAQKMYGYVALGPVTSIVHMTNLWMKDLLKHRVIWLWNLEHRYKFLPTPPLDSQLHDDLVWICADCPVCCNEFIEMVCGRDHGAFNNSRMNVMAGHEPGGTSVQNIHHWTQMVFNATFQALDLGEAANILKYGSRHPPVYDLAKIPQSLPMMVYSGSHDELADPEDVQDLINTLRANGMQDLYWKEVPKYAHLDYVWALDAPNQIYIEASDTMRNWVDGL